MISRLARIQLVVFAVIAVLGVVYVGVQYVGLGRLFIHPYRVSAHFVSYSGLYAGAEVDARGIKVGTVHGIELDPAGGVIAELDIDHGKHVSATTVAAIVDRSALGEEYVALSPTTSAGPYLHGGSQIVRARTSVPVATVQLLSDLESLTTSLPKADLATDLRELDAAFAGTGPALGSLLDSTSVLARTGVADLQQTIALLDASRTVLGTQDQTNGEVYNDLQQLASLTKNLRTLDPTFVQSFGRGIDASAQVTDLLKDNQSALPVLLNSLITVNGVLDPRLAAVRKTLVTYPYVIEYGFSEGRYCDSYNTTTGAPVASSCHYDPTTGLPVYSVHFGSENAPAGQSGDGPCTQGYENTKHYTPDGKPIDGVGPHETSSTPINAGGHCTASPHSPTPNVRGAQNVATDSGQGVTTAGFFDPATGTYVASTGQTTRIVGPTTQGGLADLLEAPMVTG